MHSFWQQYNLSPNDKPLLWYKSARAFVHHLIDHLIPSERNHYRPHLLSHRTLGLLSTLLIAIKVASIGLTTFGPVLPALSEAITPNTVFEFTNSAREQFKVQPLTYNSLLAKAAQAKADDMLSKGYFAHNTPEGRTPWFFIKQAGYTYISAGENLAVDFTEVEKVTDAWLNSPGHRANILNKNFKELGVGVSQGRFKGHIATFVVQMFGSPSDASVAWAQEPTPVIAQQSTVKTEPPKQVKITKIETDILGPGQLRLTITTNEAAVKVLALAGSRAYSLKPISDSTWIGLLSYNFVNDATVMVKAFDIKGSSDQRIAASVSNGFKQNYSLFDTPQTGLVQVLGWQFDPGLLEKQFYLLFIAAICSSLILAIGIRRHIQHIGMIANASFVVVLAVLLWYV